MKNLMLLSTVLLCSSLSLVPICASQPSSCTPSSGTAQNPAFSVATIKSRLMAAYQESAAVKAELTTLKSKNPESLTDAEKSRLAQLADRSVCLEKEILAQKVFVSALLLKVQAPKV